MYGLPYDDVQSPSWSVLGAAALNLIHDGETVINLPCESPRLGTFEEPHLSLTALEFWTPGHWLRAEVPAVPPPCAHA